MIIIGTSNSGWCWTQQQYHILKNRGTASADCGGGVVVIIIVVVVVIIIISFVCLIDYIKCHIP